MIFTFPLSPIALVLWRNTIALIYLSRALHEELIRRKRNPNVQAFPMKFCVPSLFYNLFWSLQLSGGPRKLSCNSQSLCRYMQPTSFQRSHVANSDWVLCIRRHLYKTVSNEAVGERSMKNGTNRRWKFSVPWLNATTLQHVAADNHRVVLSLTTCYRWIIDPSSNWVLWTNMFFTQSITSILRNDGFRGSPDEMSVLSSCYLFSLLVFLLQDFYTNRL